MSAADRSPVSLEQELLPVAAEAARAAAAELMPRFGHSQAGIRSKSSPTDLVSDADVSAERGDPRACSPSTGRRTRSWVRRAARPAPASCAG